MAIVKACYRKLKGYKYQLMEDYPLQIKILPKAPITKGFIRLTKTGKLTIKRGYAWDGPSGLTLDTRNFMRGSLVHDALYQLMRERHLDHVKDRKRADALLHDICREDGMSKLRADYVYKAVRTFGLKSAKPRKKPKNKIICVP